MKIVIKVGTSSICDETFFTPKLSNIASLVQVIVTLRKNGHSVILVSSGAVGFGLVRLALKEKPKELSKVQAAAAIGQGRLMALYDSLFGQFEVPIAQVLLTRDTLADRGQYLNAVNTLKELLSYNVLPIVNENDTVSHTELRFGDNDSLSAIAAGMINADLLFLLTDVDALYTGNPRTNQDVQPLRIITDFKSLRDSVNVSTAGSSIGTGGMITKLVAAELASAAGISTVITLGSEPERIFKILDDIQSNLKTLSYGTLFVSQGRVMEDRKWWILHGLYPYGTITIDDGAVASLKAKRSLFAAGIKNIDGIFNSSQAVKILSESNLELARGIVNYSSIELSRIKGCKSNQIVNILGYCESEEVIHRNNIALL